MDRKELHAVIPRRRTPPSFADSAERRHHTKKRKRELGVTELLVRSRSARSNADDLSHGQPATGSASNEHATNLPCGSSRNSEHLPGVNTAANEPVPEEQESGFSGIYRDATASTLPRLTPPTRPKARKDDLLGWRSSSFTTQSWPSEIPSAWKSLFLDTSPPKGTAEELPETHHLSPPAPHPNPDTKCESKATGHTSVSPPVVSPPSVVRPPEGRSRPIFEGTNSPRSRILATLVDSDFRRPAVSGHPGKRRPAVSGHPAKRDYCSKGAIARVLDEERAMRKAAQQRSPDCDAGEDERLLWKMYFDTASPVCPPRMPASSRVPSSTPKGPLSGAMSPVRTDLKSEDSTRGPRVGDSSGLCRMSAIILIAVFGIVTVMVAWFIFYQRGRQPEPMLCLTDDCRKHADHLTVHVNYSVPPCQDFKQHICSAWKPPIGHSDVSSTTRSIDTLIWGKSFGLFLDEAEHSSLVAKKPRAMFHACIAKRMDRQSEADGFLSFLDQRNLSWPKLPLPGRSALGVLIYLALHWRQYFWLTLRFQTETGANSGKIRILMTSGNKDVLIYLATNYMRLQLSNNYHRYWMMHYKTMYGKRAPAPSAEQIDASGSVFARVLKLLLDAIMKGPKQPLQTRLSQIGRYTGRLTSSHWMEQLNVQVSDRFAFTGEEEVLVSDRLLLETIGQLFGQYNDSELIREMTWEFVQVHIAVVDAHGVAMTLGGRDNVEGYVRGFCAFIVDEIYRTLLDSLYVALRRTSDDGRLITVGLGSIIQKAIDKVNSSWLSDDSKRTALQKYEAMRIGVWPPDILDESVARAYRCFPTRGKTFVLFWIAAHECRGRITGTSFERNTSSVYGLISCRLADYDYLTNTVHMAVTALTDPLYYARGTRAMFYAGIGFLFATQMMKVQDMAGIKVLPNGSIVDRPWLETSDLGRFEDKRRCLGARAEGYLVPAISALEVTYAVFTEDGGVNFTRRPITNNMTEAQVFFSTVCEMACYTENNLWLPRTDCNALVQNSRHFAEAYDCPPGSPMNPKRKCGFFD